MSLVPDKNILITKSFPRHENKIFNKKYIFPTVQAVNHQQKYLITQNDFLSRLLQYILGK